MSVKKIEKDKKQAKSEKLFGIPRDQLSLVRGFGGVIIESPRRENDNGVIIP